MYHAEIICDSISSAGARLTTFVVTFPRFILPQFNTHSALSKNGASGRAIPLTRQIEEVQRDPFLPEHPWPRAKPGMKGEEVEIDWTDDHASEAWYEAYTHALECAMELDHLKIHKSIASRLLEPFKWQTMVVTATDWENYFNLRCDDAQPEHEKIARAMRYLRETSTPRVRQVHLPFVGDYEAPDLTYDVRAKLSAARCCRVTYLKHFEVRDIDADLNKSSELIAAGHMSPFEHQGKAFKQIPGSNYLHFGVENTRSGNFKGWEQFRKTIPGEAVFRR